MARKTYTNLISQLQQGVQWERHGDMEPDIPGANELMREAAKEIERLIKTLDRTTRAYHEGFIKELK